MQYDIPFVAMILGITGDFLHLFFGSADRFGLVVALLTLTGLSALGPLHLGQAITKVPRRMMPAKDTNGDEHWNRLPDPEQPLGAERIAVHTFGELAHAIDTAYHDGNARHVHCEDDLLPSHRSIMQRVELCQVMEAHKDAQEDAEADELERQPADENPAPNLLVGADPVV